MKYAHICAMLIFVCALTISGCTDKKDSGSELTSSLVSLENDTAAVDAILIEGNVSITDAEIQDMEQEMKELETLILEMEKEGNITIEEI
ncbi:MAG: hypothetical protein WBL02_08505 [Methanomethylovorans sp.]|uniref:hypothetical protein n=1 Tax=Methanomethylovorans sp. TaxID=2758717 RepID=UPI000AD2395D|nr:hypothetical protein [Methanomethylovorans sp.]